MIPHRSLLAISMPGLLLCWKKTGRNGEFNGSTAIDLLFYLLLHLVYLASGYNPVRTIFCRSFSKVMVSSRSRSVRELKRVPGLSSSLHEHVPLLTLPVVSTSWLSWLSSDRPVIAFARALAGTTNEGCYVEIKKDLSAVSWKTR